MAGSWRIIIVTLSAMPLAGGCSRSTSTPPSAFFSAVNLDAIAKTSAPKDVTWGSNGRVSGGGGGAGSFHRETEFEGDFKCQPESLDKFLQALKEELQKAVKTHGGEISGLKDLAGDPGTKGFSFEYSEGAASGKIQVVVAPSKGPRRDEYPHYLTITANEPGMIPEAGVGTHKK